MSRIARGLGTTATVLVTGLAVVIIFVVVAVTAAGSASAAYTHEIGLSGFTPIEVGRGTAVKAEGQAAPPGEYLDESWILAVAIPASVMPECPADASSAGATAEQVGTIMAIAMVPHADANGHFSNTIGYTPLSAGPVLICAYLYNEVGYTWAWSSLHLEVVGGPGAPTGASPGGSRGGAPTGPSSSGAPLNLTLPWVTSAGRNLRCHPGTWSNATGGYSIRWFFDGRATRITGPTAVSLGAGNRGHKVSCRVTAWGPGETHTTVLSPPLRLRR